MSRTVPAHGTRARRFGCKSRPPCLCSTCVHGSRRQRKTVDFRRSQGISGHVPVGPVAAHVRSLVLSGRSLIGIARAADLDVATVRRAIDERRKTVWRSTAEALLAVPKEQDLAALVDATGTIRRLRALVVMGHDQKTLAAEVGCAFTYISMLTHEKRVQVTVALEQSVRRAYGQLSMKVGPSVYGRSRAVRNGWFGPLAWDDDTIDDPQAQPLTDAVEPIATEGGNVADRWLHGESVILRPEDRKQVLQHLFEWTNDTPEEIADRLEMTIDAVWQTWSRIKKKARQEGRTEPWRRVYVPRERSLNQNQMEEVA